MKLSEAIREGCKDTEKGIGACPEKGCCALEAAARSITKNSAGSWHKIIKTLNELFPELNANDSALWQEIVYRNDHTAATREEIADWLETKGL